MAYEEGPALSEGGSPTDGWGWGGGGMGAQAGRRASLGVRNAGSACSRPGRQSERRQQESMWVGTKALPEAAGLQGR